MNPRLIPLLVILLLSLSVGGDWLRSEQPTRTRVTEVSLIAYESNDSRLWEIWAEREMDGVVDTVRISPDTSRGAYGFSEPVLMGEGSHLFCAMLVHKQVKGDSAFILIRGSDDFGQTWESVRAVGRNTAIARHSRAFYKNGVIHLVWEDCRSGYWRTYYDAIPIS